MSVHFTPFEPRPGLRQLAGVARGPIQGAMLQDLVEDRGVDPDDWNVAGRDSFPTCRGWASHLGMADRLRDALCQLGWMTTYRNFRVVLEPITAESLRAETLLGVPLNPPPDLLRFLFEPVAGVPLDDAVIRWLSAILMERVPGEMADLVGLALMVNGHARRPTPEV